ncbi:hypothetical protein COCON_G00163790 [Conger conger]|uniref:Uncharacterized protein n=1 Tax=Conger conger TaxID=82655 RepID=A0A9Q1D6L9_CONCO|nr:hypothetical protein COCON_G00163790 [Conger conger]
MLYPKRLISCTDLIVPTLEPPTFQVPVRHHNHWAIGCFHTHIYTHSCILYIYL